MLLEKAFQCAARTRTRFADQQRLGGESLRLDAPFAGERVVRRRDEYQGVLGKYLGHGFKLGRRRAHDGQVDVVLGKMAHDGAAVVDRQLQFDTRMAATVLGQQRGRKILGGADHAYLEAAGFDPLERRHGFAGLAQLLGNAPRLARNFLAGGGQPHLLAGLLGQRQPGQVFQRLYLHRHRGLGQVQFFGGTREREVAGNGLEYFQLAQGGVFHAERAPGKRRVTSKIRPILSSP